jgi:hypothetical protein
MNDPLFGLEDMAVNTPIEIYKTVEPDIHYITPNDENAVLEENEDAAWIQALNEEATIWQSNMWTTER